MFLNTCSSNKTLHRALCKKVQLGIAKAYKFMFCTIPKKEVKNLMITGVGTKNSKWVKICIRIQVIKRNRFWSQIKVYKMQRYLMFDNKFARSPLANATVFLIFSLLAQNIIPTSFKIDLNYMIMQIVCLLFCSLAVYLNSNVVVYNVQCTHIYTHLHINLIFLWWAFCFILPNMISAFINIKL